MSEAHPRPYLAITWSNLHGHPCQHPFYRVFMLVLILSQSCISQSISQNITLMHHHITQVALAPIGTQACTLDIAKFHRTCPVLPDHKPFIVVQGHEGEFYVDHTHPFGAASASSNAGMIGNAIVDIWITEGIKPVFKYEDDLNILRYPVP